MLLSHLSTWARAGIGFVLTGLLIAGSVLGWFWMTDRVVSVPVSIVAGSVQSKSFRAFATQNYIARIEVQRTIPFDDLNCMLGTWHAGDPPCKKERLLYGDWKVQSDGTTVAGGSIESDCTGAWGDTISCEFNPFQADAGKRYTVSVAFTKDGPALAVTHPRLVVAGADPYRGLSSGFVLWPVFFLLELVGITLLIVAFVQWCLS
jgi:hypothetical protein